MLIFIQMDRNLLKFSYVFFDMSERDIVLNKTKNKLLFITTKK